MIDFIKKLFIPKYKPMGHFRPCLADTYSNEAQSRGLGSKNENDICPRCLGGGQNIQNKFLSTKFSQHLSGMAVMLWEYLTLSISK